MTQINYKTEWDLSTFYKSLDDPSIDRDIQYLKEVVDKFANKYKGKIKNITEENFEEYFEDDNEIDKLIFKIHAFISYTISLNTQNQKAIKKEGEFMTVLTELSNKTLFISQEFKEVGYDKLIEFSKSEKLKKYKNYFYQKANAIKYLLDEKTEFALNLKENSGKSSFVNLYSELTNSFMFKITINGETQELTDPQIRALRSNPNESIRKAAHESIRNVYLDKNIQITLGNTYSAIVKNWTSEVKLRKYSNPLEIRNKREEFDNEIIETLLTEVKNSFPLYHRYLKVKAKILNKEKLEVWDLMAPISTKEKKFNFEDSLNLYLNLIKDFDEEFYKYSIDMFEKGRVDIFPKKGKKGGAFASYAKGFESFVLLNHADRLEDVMTLAHELGHAIHGHLSQIQPEQTYDSPLSLAETASIFNETLLGEKIMKELNKEEKLDFLDKKLQEIFATIYRQIQYVLFEKKVHETILSGKELTYEDFNKIWREEQTKLTGTESVNYLSKPEEEIGWSTIPHIFRTPFYCYAYAFGNILSFALYERYKKEGKPFIEKYKNILRAGGSKPPYELLKENGFDIKSPTYYKEGLKVVEDLVVEFENLSQNL